MLDTYRRNEQQTQWTTDAMIKTQEDFFIIIFTSHFIARVWKVVWGFTVRGSWRLNINCNILTPLLWPSCCVFLVLLMLNRMPRGSLCWVIYYILSATSLVPKLHRGSRGPPRPGVAFPTTTCLQLSGTLLATPLARRTQLSYIIIRRPLDLWNRMFNRHQAEITVMQFRGHSLPVHLSMSVPWEFFSSSHLMSQFPPTRFPHITAIGMCHFLPVHHLGISFLGRVEGQNSTVWAYKMHLNWTLKSR